MAVFAKRYLRFSEKVSSGKSVLWPVYVYRIIYPDFSDKPLNLFQEGILGLFRAGCKKPEEIAGLLSLNEDLVKFIIETQLKPNGYLSTEYKITNKGRKILDGEKRRKGSLHVNDEEPQKVKLKTGFAFWDAAGQQWLPRLTAQLNEVEPSRANDKGFPVFAMERQKGKHLTPYRLQTHFPKPELQAEALLAAYRSYRLDIHHAKQLGASVDREQQVALKSIEFVGDEPEPYYLWVSLTKNSNSLEPWSVADPFNIRSHASWLRKPVFDIIEREPGLAKQLGSLVDKAQAEEQTHSEFLRSVDDEVRLQVLAEYPYLSGYSSITAHLGAILRQRINVQEGQSNQEQLRGLLTESQSLIESILKWMLDRWVVDLRRLPRGREQIEKNAMKRIYLHLDLDGLSSEIIEQLILQPWWKVHSALYWKGSARQSAKALLCGVILAASDNNEHPFELLTPDDLNFDLLFELLNTRNEAGHASGQEFSTKETLALSSFAIQWLQNFKEWF